MRMFRPLGDAVLVRRMEEPNMGNKSAVILPESANPAFMYGEVLAVGPGAATQHGGRIETEVKPGDRVYFRERGSEFLRELDVWKTSERAILGVLDEDAQAEVPIA